MATSTRREALYRMGKGSSGTNVVPATVKFRHNKRQGLIEPLSSVEKMICALRKVLTEMSDNDANGCRYYIADNAIQLTERPTTTEGREGEARTYRATGRCKVGVIHPGDHISSMIIQFLISYRDVQDDRGLADVEYIEPTTIDTLPKTTKIS